jgi:hypothetical protein
MKSVVALLASAMLVGTLAAGNAQNTSSPLPSQTPAGQNQGAERSPDGTPGGSMQRTPSPPNADRAAGARTAPLDQGNANQGSSGGSTTGAGGLNQSDPGYTPDRPAR